MKSANDILEELRSMDSILAELPRTMPYHVPDGYFKDLARSTRQTISYIEEKEEVPNWGKKMPYAVPDNYFSELTGNVLAQTIDIAKPASFSVPAGYFESLPMQMLNAAKAADAPQQKAKVIPLKRNNIFRQIRWAAAAVLVMGLGFGAYQSYFNEQQPVTPENILASIPGNDIEEYVEGNYRVDGDRIASNTNVNDLQLDTKDIIEYLNETGWD